MPCPNAMLGTMSPIHLRRSSLPAPNGSPSKSPAAAPSHAAPPQAAPQTPLPANRADTLAQASRFANTCPFAAARSDRKTPPPDSIHASPRQPCNDSHPPASATAATIPPCPRYPDVALAHRAAAARAAATAPAPESRVVSRHPKAAPSNGRVAHPLPPTLAHCQPSNNLHLTRIAAAGHTDSDPAARIPTHATEKAARFPAVPERSSAPASSNRGRPLPHRPPRRAPTEASPHPPALSATSTCRSHSGPESQPVLAAPLRML